MKTTRTILMAAAAMLAMAAVSCTKDEDKGDGGETTVYTLELADQLDKKIILNDNEARTISVKLNTNLEADQISVEPKEDQEWCTATLSDDGKSITVTPGGNAEDKDQSATFVVSATVEGVSSFEFTVIRRALGTEYVIESIEGDGLTQEEDSYIGTIISYTAEALSPKALTITVYTNASTWYFADSNMVYDDDTEWYTVDRRSGRNGETITITFKENTGTSTRRAMFYFDVKPFKGDYPYSEVSVTVNQNATPAKSVTAVYDESRENEFTDGETVNIGKDSYRTSFYVETDGGIASKLVMTGTNEADPSFDGENDWVFSGSSNNEITLNVLANNTGKERSIDLLITPAGSDTELFRLKLVQAGE